MIYKITAILALVSIIAGCANNPRVESDYDMTFNFNDLKTYYALETPADEINNQAALTLADQRILNSLQKEMQDKNIQQTNDPKNADIHLAYHVTTRERTRFRNYNLRVGYGFHRYPFGVSYRTGLDVDQYLQGTLVIDAINPNTNKVIWRGTGVKRLSDHWTYGEAKRKIAEYVAAIMEEFPVNSITPAAATN